MISASAESPEVFASRTGFDSWFAGGAMFLASGAFLWLLRSQASLTSGARTGEIGTDLLWGTVYLVAACRILLSRTASTIFSQVPKLLLLLYALACASLFWSDAPGLTAMKLAALLGGGVFANYLSVQFAGSDLLALLGRMFIWSVLLCFAAILLVPSEAIGTGDFAGVWQGIYTHKNALGLNMTLSLIVFASTQDKASSKSSIRYIIGALAILLLLFSQSSTSLVVFLLCALIFALRNIVRKRIKLTIAILVLALIAMSAVDKELALSKFLDTVDRDTTLTGRTGVWGASLLMATERPLLGYGYGAFWRGAEGPSSEVWKLSSFEAFYSHNGFLDVLLDLGFLGVGLLVATLVHYLILAVRFWRAEPAIESFWPILLWTYLVFSNLTEGSFLAANGLAWILFLTSYLQIYRRTQLLLQEQQG